MSVDLSVLQQKYIVEKKSIRTVATEMGLDRHDISKYLIDAGIPIRDRRKEDIIDRRFGKWTVLSKSQETGKWLCKCDCGNISHLQRANFDGGTTLSCGCFKKSLHGSNSRYWKGYEGITGAIWSSIVSGAERRKLDIKVDKEYIWNLFLSQNNICAISGLDIALPVSREKTCDKYLQNPTASLDRIDSSLGYVSGNLQWVHKDVNRMKWDFKLDYFIDMCLLVGNKSCSTDAGHTFDTCCDRKRSRNGLFSGVGCIFGRTWKEIRSHAKERKIPFNLTVKEAWTIYLNQNGVCSLGGLPIGFNAKWDSRERTASLDRIDSELGYTVDNTQWVHVDINTMKSNFDQDYFRELCGKVARHAMPNSQGEHIKRESILEDKII